MSGTSDSTLNTIKTLVDAFKTGATAPAGTTKTTVESAFISPSVDINVGDVCMAA